MTQESKLEPRATQPFIAPGCEINQYSRSAAHDLVIVAAVPLRARMRIASAVGLLDGTQVQMQYLAPNPYPV